MKKDGGPAYPAPGVTGYENDKGEIEYVNWPGMTLRDYFAAKAMAAEISRGYGHFPSAADWIVPRAYQWADAMIKEREK